MATVAAHPALVEHTTTLALEETGIPYDFHDRQADVPLDVELEPAAAG